MIKAAIFDLDGVLVNTSIFHFAAWRDLARYLGFDLTDEDNERLKGVSRMEALDIILEIGGISDLTYEEKLRLAERKNRKYIEYIYRLDESCLLDGALECLNKFKEKKVLIALGSASKNAPMVLEKLKIASYFDTISDGTRAVRAKPDPEVFKIAADDLGVPYEQCMVFEDSIAGIMAAKATGMKTVGIGEAKVLHMADMTYKSLKEYVLNNHIDEIC